ncbi:MAG: DUF3592 domain-containing protein [Pseudomonadota bacterium]
MNTSTHKPLSKPSTGRLGGTLFGLPFAAVGVGMLTWCSLSTWESVQIADWPAVDAIVIDGGYRTNSGEDSDTYKAWGSYRYTYQGREYVSTRVAINGGSDNIGSFQRDLGGRLARAAATGEPVIAWVNPQDPTDAVIDRSMRWGLQVFKLAFGLIFGAVGFGVIWGSWRTAPLIEAAQELRGKRTGTEWLANPDWQGEPIRSNARSAARAAWVFAGLWNLVSFPVGFLVFNAYTDEGNTAALIGLLFPIVGVGLAAWALRTSREWWRFGPAPVELDPFPGSIGGHVAGRILLSTMVDPSQQFEVTLSLIRSKRGSESRRETARWQRTQRVRAMGGKTIEFRFDVPEGLAESDTELSGTYDIWRLHVLGDMAGPDFDRDYVIPVYATQTESKDIDARGLEAAAEEQHRFDDDALAKLVRSERAGMYADLVFPAGQHLQLWFAALVFGAVFAGAGAFLFHAEDAPLFMAIVFSAIGGLIAFYGIYGAGRSLRVSRSGATVTARRYWLGIPLGSRSVNLTRILHFRAQKTMSSQSGGRHAVYYALHLVDEEGEARVGEGLKGLNEVEALARRLTRELQLPELGLEHKSQDLAQRLNA